MKYSIVVIPIAAVEIFLSVTDSFGYDLLEIVCQEATRKMRVGPAGAGCKPPQAAVVRSHGGER
jgi:hypothetical protein